MERCMDMQNEAIITGVLFLLLLLWNIGDTGGRRYREVRLMVLTLHEMMETTHNFWKTFIPYPDYFLFFLNYFFWNRCNLY